MLMLTKFKWHGWLMLQAEKRFGEAIAGNKLLHHEIDEHNKARITFEKVGETGTYVEGYILSRKVQTSATSGHDPFEAGRVANGEFCHIFFCGLNLRCGQISVPCMIDACFITMNLPDRRCLHPFL